MKTFKSTISDYQIKQAKWSAKFNYHPNDIITFLNMLGYSPYVINGEQLRKFNWVDEDTVETNYFFLHHDKHANLIKQIVK